MAALTASEKPTQKKQKKISFKTVWNKGKIKPSDHIYRNEFMKVKLM
jgi:hypothetical protein